MRRISFNDVASSMCDCTLHEFSDATVQEASMLLISTQICTAWTEFLRSLQLSSVSVFMSPCIYSQAKPALHCNAALAAGGLQYIWRVHTKELSTV
jgi:hypothetical protein